uniref:hypothetical protein n=1 Tax=Alistipes sp. TaxID=1872444 RepID=UPI0040577910
MRISFTIGLFLTLFFAGELKAQSYDAVTDIEEFWVEEDAEWQGKTGAVIHLTFTIENMKGRTMGVGAFFWDEDQNPVRAVGVPSKNRSVDGCLCVWETIYSRYESTYWEDYKIWVPYSLFRQDGSYYCALQIVARDGSVLGMTDPYEFSVYR